MDEYFLKGMFLQWSSTSKCVQRSMQNNNNQPPPWSLKYFECTKTDTAAVFIY